MIGKLAIAIVVLAVTAEQVASRRVHIMHIKLDDSHLLKVVPFLYGLSAVAVSGPPLASRNFSSICVNNQTVAGYGLNCEQVVKDLDDISDLSNEDMTLIRTQLNRASGPMNPITPEQKYYKTIYSSVGNQLKMVINMSSSIHHVGHYEVDVYDNEYSVASTKSAEPLPFDWLRYFVFGDKVAFVNQDHTLHLLERKCLSEEQKTFISNVEKELNEAKIFA